MTNYLIADIGGTNSRLAIYNTSKDKIILKKKYKTNDFDSLTDIMIEFLSIVIDKKRLIIKNAVLAIATNTSKKKLRFPNSKIEIDKKDVLKKTSLVNIHFLNDLEAKAYYFKNLDNSSSKKENKLVIFPGTGLGVSCIDYNDKKCCYVVRANEWGHRNFRSSNEREKQLRLFLKKELEILNIEWETLLSGKGLERIYLFLINTKYKYSKPLGAKKITKNYNNDKCSKDSIIFFLELLRKDIFKLSKNDNCKEVYLGGVIIRAIVKELGESELKKYIKTYEKLNLKLHVIMKKETGLLGVINYINYHL